MTDQTDTELQTLLEFVKRAAAPEEKLLNDKDVAEKLAISRASVWRFVSEGKLPRPVRLSESTQRWKASELNSYLASLQAEESNLSSTST